MFLREEIYSLGVIVSSQHTYTSNGVVVAVWLVSTLAPKFHPEGYFLGPLLVSTCLSVSSSYCIGKCGSGVKDGCKAGEEGPITKSATSKGIWLLAPGKYFESSRSCLRSICPREKKVKHVFICWHHRSKICLLRRQPLPTPAPLGCNCLGPEWFQQSYDPIDTSPEAEVWSHGNLKWAIRGSNALALLNLYIEIHSWYIFYQSTLQLLKPQLSLHKRDHYLKLTDCSED